mmetsp:Transcript_86358/g.225312  ORF Transcript_86358/g.225312 Transcript_86358/m.225312 type:complete len:275 (-) Transcript_86358:205-1029(-)
MLEIANKCSMICTMMLTFACKVGADSQLMQVRTNTKEANNEMPPEYLNVEWPCSNPTIGASLFSLRGTSAAGAPFYSNSDHTDVRVGPGAYLYWDPSCDAVSAGVPRWIVDVEQPSASVANDLDLDTQCSYFGHYATSLSSHVPLGALPFFAYCDGNLTDMTVTITVPHGAEPGLVLEPASRACYTSVQGDRCYEHVLWAMQTGIVEHPDWYQGLTKDSSFEDFQQHLHGSARLSAVCPKPCFAPEAAKLAARTSDGIRDFTDPLEGTSTYTEA